MKEKQTKTISHTDIVYTAIFGSLWGLSEIFFGTALQTMRIPFRGAIMSVAAVMILTCSKEFVRYRSSIIVIGAVAATLKAFSMMNFSITPIVAIFLEALIVEAVFLIMGYHVVSSMIGGGFILLYTFTHGLIMHGIFFGSQIYRLYINILKEIASWLNVHEGNLYLFLIAIALMYFVVGAVFGSIGWLIAQRANKIIQEDLP